ncbi:hypothetical protein [Acrocarpospora corrugata]|uniref:hypothetical protein n=1 Tax=Acrocarpospora corrugata TaxID=35763 RepID=UPI0014786C65|nr:hypothetical protein [Acrocarpospora corrugata]
MPESVGRATLESAGRAMPEFVGRAMLIGQSDAIDPAARSFPRSRRTLGLNGAG